MNLAQSPIPAPSAPINFALPDTTKWKPREDFYRIQEKKEQIADTLADVREVLTYPMSIAQIRAFLPDAPKALKDWVTVWTQQGHLQRTRIGSSYVYSLGKGSE